MDNAKDIGGNEKDNIKESINFDDYMKNSAQNIEETSLDESGTKSCDAELDNNNSDDTDDIQTMLKKSEEKCFDLSDRLQRSLAEFDNFRKRTAKEKASMYDDGASDTIIKLLPIIDNFERAINSYTKDEEDNFYKGIVLILKQLEEMLVSVGVTEILSIGEKFDPNIHYAVMHIDDKKYGENEITEVMQKGYMYKEKVIRHSMVKVAN